MKHAWDTAVTELLTKRLLFRKKIRKKAEGNTERIMPHQWKKNSSSDRTVY